MQSGGAGIVFENAGWAVGPAGLEHKATGYLIERDLLGARRTDGLWDWPLHMLEKTWCAADDFIEAFGAALRAHGVTPDAGLAASFAAALEPTPLRDAPRPRRRHELETNTSVPSRNGAWPPAPVGRGAIIRKPCFDKSGPSSEDLGDAGCRFPLAPGTIRSGLPDARPARDR